VGKRTYGLERTSQNPKERTQERLKGKTVLKLRVEIKGVREEGLASPENREESRDEGIP